MEMFEHALCHVLRLLATTLVSRQHELALEELWWVTQNPWFRLNTTFVGMTVTDTFLLARYSAADDSG